MLRVAGLLAAVVIVLQGGVVSGADPSPAAGSDGPGWTTAKLSVPKDANVLVAGVAAGPDQAVIVGGRVCEIPPGGAADGPWRCHGQAWTSRDGSTWTAAKAATVGLDLGYVSLDSSGPEVGIGGVAHGPGGWVAHGLQQPRLDGPQRAAIWRSADGSTWEQVDTGKAFPAGTHLTAILGASDGYLLAGVVHARRAPRAAIWSSADGLRWVRVKGDEVADIGGYIDTMEEPGSGGIRSLTLAPGPTEGGAIGDGAVAAGSACFAPMDDSIWAWNGICWAHLWRTPDGQTWSTSSAGGVSSGLHHVAALGDRLLVGTAICEECPDVLLLTEDGQEWNVPFATPVGDRTAALLSTADRFVSVMTPEPAADHPLVVWSSATGSDWVVDDSQPTVPASGRVREVAATTWMGRLLLAVTVETDSGPTPFVSFALLGPAVDAG